jgi:hypothetical protein
LGRTGLQDLRQCGGGLSGLLNFPAPGTSCVHSPRRGRGHVLPENHFRLLETSLKVF